MISPKILLSKALLRLNALFGRGLVVSMSVVVLLSIALSIALSLAAFMFLNTAAPRTLTIASGPPGSSFQRSAERYQKILEREGVTLTIVPSEGSADNLAKLADAKQKVDLGFVLGGEAKDAKYENLMSLGSVAFQPLMVFYTGAPRQLLSEFKGLRLNIGPEGSGTHRLALALLKANGIVPGDGTVFDQTDLDDPGRSWRKAGSIWRS